MLVPLLGLFDRWPMTRGDWVLRAPAYAVAMTGIALSQIVLMWALRVAAYSVLGWGEYDYGEPRYILPMELLRALPAYLGVLGLHALWRTTRAESLRSLQVVELERELTQARLDLLTAQLQPHFLFNALNTARTLVHEDAEAADRMIGRLADFLRLSLRHGTADEVPLSIELELLDAYLAVMKARFEEQLVVTVTVAEGLSPRLPPLLLQPLTENAIRHAMMQHESRGRVDVDIRRRGERLCLRVSDNGHGAASPDGGGLGVGLSNSRRRLAALYGDAFGLTTSEPPGGGFEVTVELPFREAS
jgi:LytS/YehU family sensor histidine kinase